MIKFVFSVFAVMFVVMTYSCASNESYNTASFKYRETTVSRNMIALNPGGLTQQQIQVISSTKPPSKFPVDIAILFIENGYLQADLKNTLRHGIVKELQKNSKIGRITIIPDFIIPNAVSFSSIQELGIRSLSELTIVFYFDASEIFQKYTFMEGDKIKITSTMDYMIVDSYTSAILTTDKLYSEKIYTDDAFKTGEETKAFKELLKEQARILGNSINNLFKKSDNQ